MKKLAWFCVSAMTVSSFVACGVKDRSQATRLAKASDKQTQEGNDKDKGADDKNLLAGKCKALESANIYLGGKLKVTSKDGANSIAENVVTIHTVNGTNLPNLFEAIKQDPSEKSLAALDAAAKAKTYLRLGCDKNTLPIDIANNWKEIKLEDAKQVDTQDLGINTVFICGSKPLQSSIINLIADRIVMAKDASLQLADANSGALNILVNTLEAKGNNKISTTTIDGTTGMVTLNIDVRSSFSIDTQDKLELVSIVKTCSAEAQTNDNKDDKKDEQSKVEEQAAPEKEIPTKTEEKASPEQDKANDSADDASEIKVTLGSTDKK